MVCIGFILYVGPFSDRAARYQLISRPVWGSGQKESHVLAYHTVIPIPDFFAADDSSKSGPNFPDASQYMSQECGGPEQQDARNPKKRRGLQGQLDMS